LARAALALAAAALLLPATAAARFDPAALVDPMVGTGTPYPERGVFGHGATFPGAVAPFGMLQWTPYTDPAEPGGYDYAAQRITGFPLTALSGGGCGALNDVSFMPWSGPVPPPASGTPFSHRNERARPGYYRVSLGSPGVRVELTAGARSGLARIAYPRGPVGVLGLKSTARPDGSTPGGFRAVGHRGLEGSVVGGEHCGRRSRYRLYFTVLFDRPFRRVTGRPLEDGWVSFDTSREPRLGVRAAISYVSAAGARRNLRTGIPSFRFDDMRRATAADWRRLLGRVRVQGGSQANTRRLYTGLYHSLIEPSRFSDADGRYRGTDGRAHRARGWTQYTNLAGWDAYRSWAPLLAVVAPRTARDLARSLVADAQQCGAVPRWLLAGRETGALVGDGGSHTLATLDAFGVVDYPRRLALRAMLAAAERPGRRCDGYQARPGLQSYLRLGFVPADEPGGTYGPSSTTLEYASTDFAVAMLARRLRQHAAAARLLGRTGAWRHLFDPGPGLVRPRLRDGSPAGGEETLGSADFVEGNARQYTWLVPHDLRGLVRALGGQVRADQRLNSLLEQLNAGLDAPHAFLGNEPSFLLPWIHNWTGRPDEAQADVRRALDSLYVGGPAGLPGNDDLGALSSWSVWAALGLYPAIPGLGGLTVASPVFPRTTIALGDRRRLVIEAPGAGPARPYVRALRLGRSPVKGPWVPWSALAGGATLHFALGARPSGWGASTPPP
jgi:predicted alpha-1,2-mannosidase